MACIRAIEARKHSVRTWTCNTSARHRRDGKLAPPWRCTHWAGTGYWHIFKVRFFLLIYELQIFNEFAHLYRIFVYPIKYPLFKSPKSGAQTQIRLSVDPELETVTGKYFSDCTEARTSSLAKNDELAAWLWKTSEEWTGMSIPNTIAWIFDEHISLRVGELYKCELILA